MRIVYRFGRGLSVFDVFAWQSVRAGLHPLAWIDMRADDWMRAVKRSGVS